MPCYDPETHERPIRLEEKVHRLTDLLCRTCKKLDQSDPNMLLASDPELFAWWQDHKEQDAMIAAIRAKRDILGWDSLTPKERRFMDRDRDISMH